jgi:2-dehydro-3-deoxygalactonokinase
MRSRTAVIGIDWGTSAFRAYRIDAEGGVLETSVAPAGILEVEGGAFEAALEREIGAWLAAAPHVPVIASGMITSRQGWVEVPYCACPAGSGELAAALRPLVTGGGRTIHFVPGMSLIGGDGVPDVIRGEETQIIGELSGEVGHHPARRAFVLPGTHSKWAYTEGGRIVWFATFMTGEVFAVLKTHSILGRLMAKPSAKAAPDEAAFARGLAYGQRGPGGLLKRLFSARTLGLFDQLPASGIAPYLSGLLIGTEIAEARACLPDDPLANEITVIGSSELAERYRGAIEAAGLRVRTGHPEASARGQLLIAQAAGLVP